jgi:hypothetical protein
MLHRFKSREHLLAGPILFYIGGHEVGSEIPDKEIAEAAA